MARKLLRAEVLVLKALSEGPMLLSDLQRATRLNKMTLLAALILLDKDECLQWSKKEFSITDKGQETFRQIPGT